MTHRSAHRHTFPGVVIIGLVVMVGACVPVEMSHVDGREFDPQLEIVMPNSARIAVDSCSTGIHALVELDLRTDQLAMPEFADEPGMSEWSKLTHFSPVEPLDLQLIYDDQLIAAFDNDELEGPICIRDRYEYDFDGRLQRSDVSKTCMYRYRAEFELRHLPKNTKGITLRYGNQLVYLANRD